MKEKHITQEQLKEFVHYDPETGIFTWIKNVYHPKYGYLMHKEGKKLGSNDKNGYLIIKNYHLGNRYYKLHRLAFLYMTGKLPEKSIQVDHINHTPDDNRWENLRLATKSQNMFNMNKHKNAKASKYKGVLFFKRTGKWTAKIRTSEGRVSLGYYNSEREAAIVYNEAAKKYHGEFALLNEIEYSQEEYHLILTSVKLVNIPNKKSKYHGVAKQKNKWEAKVNKDGIRYYLGTYRTEEEAAEAYNRKVKELFGNSAKINVIK